MVGVVMLSVILLNVNMLSVVAPFMPELKKKFYEIGPSSAVSSAHMIGNMRFGTFDVNSSPSNLNQML
jgi:hypothetical protein